MIAQLLEQIDPHVFTLLICAEVAFYVFCIAALLATAVVGLCWLVDFCCGQVVLERVDYPDDDDDDDALLDAFAGDTSARQVRAIQLAIEAAFFRAATPTHVAQAFSTGARKLTADDIETIWREAQAAGRLPKLKRPVYPQRERVRLRRGIAA